MGPVGSQRLQEPSVVAGPPARSMVMSFGFDGCPLEETAAAGAALGQGGVARGAPTLTDSGE